MKKFVALAILSSVVAMPAFAETFTRDGVSYSYEVKQSGSYQVISGHNLATGETFKLRVRGSRVAGSYAGRNVAFDAAGTALAAN
jgi:hypothetical protein